MTSVLQFSTMVPPRGFGGAERVVSWLADRLRDRGHVVHNAGLRARDDESAGDASPIRNVYWPFDGESHGTLARSAWHTVDALLLPARRDVRALFERVRPAVVVTHNLRGWGLAPWVVAADLGVPVVQVVHDYGLICNTGTLWRGSPCDGLCSPCRLRAGAAVRRWPGGHVVGVSQAVLDAQAAYGVTLPGPTGVAHPLAAATVTHPARRPAPAVGPARTIGFIGRLTASKGLELLLQAVAGTSCHLLVAGTGGQADEDALRRSAPTNVTWLGWTEPGELLGRVDLLVVPSAWPEPFGLVVVEAATAGVPVLLADHPGLVEAARASRARFATFVPGDAAGLRQALDQPLAGYRVEAETVSPIDLVALVSRVAGANVDQSGPTS